MDPITAAVAAVAIINVISSAVGTVAGNKNRAIRLGFRISTIVPVLNGIIDNKRRVTSPPLLEDLVKYLEEIKEFIVKFQTKGYFSKCWKSNSDAALFVDYNDGFATRITTLQFDVQIQTEKRREEDEEDDKKDREEMKQLVEQILINQGLLKDEIQRALLELNTQSESNTRLLADGQRELGNSMNELSEQNNNNMDILSQGQMEIMKMINNLNNGVTTNLPTLRSINMEQLDFEENEETFLGSGTFGTVYKGLYMGHKVAIKKMTAMKVTREQKEQLRSECLIMQMIDFPGTEMGL